MEHSIIVIFVPLMAYVLLASAQLPTSLSKGKAEEEAIHPQTISEIIQIMSNQRQFSVQDVQIALNTLGSLWKAFVGAMLDAKVDLARANTEIGIIKKQLANVTATVENLRKQINGTTNNSP
ncbi:hypothetical protein DAPPUDRAFT_241294 [Daphnia pulex]|uniref:Uncharacterized protein n=1 Tax=Daphnia pulex TaxID=6669 RepID=E9GDW9_DAPPU|nr:hypothetical protein DAPPUDRAFT_241294 [Daphnia pulex]|eukprot:EFX82159.1 hypothetical protein DAPPUDRAFT_241294 [Daphnia pulex]